MNNSFNPYGGVNPLIDKMIGNAYDIVKYVARYLKEIRYVAENMETVYIAANGNRTMAFITGDGVTNPLMAPLPSAVASTENIRTIDVAAHYNGDTITMPGPDTFEFSVSGGNVVIQLHSAIPQVELATFHIAIVHTEETF